MARSLAEALGNGWNYQRKQRLEPDHTNFPSLDVWLEYLKSPSGAAAGGGSISKFVPAKQSVHHLPGQEGPRVRDQ